MGLIIIPECQQLDTGCIGAFRATDSVMMRYFTTRRIIMNYDLAFFDRMQCSREKKKESIKLIALIISLSEKARKMGLLALEDDFETVKDPFFKKGLQLIVDGTDPVIVRDILLVRMCAGNLKGAKLLRAAIILEGMLSIQSGDNPRIAADKLSGFLGKDCDLWDRYWAKFSKNLENDGSISGGDFINGAGSAGSDSAGEGQREKTGVNSAVGSLNFEKLSGFHDIFIQKILRETDSQDLAKALKGCSGEVSAKICNNMSQRAALLLREDIEFMGPVKIEDVVQAQEKILNVALKLAEAGEIIIPDGSEIIE
jgi:hypothetical protein